MAKKPSPDSHPKPAAQPASLTGHIVPEERRRLIEAHVATLAAAAVGLSDALPFQADEGDFVRVLEAEPR